MSKWIQKSWVGIVIVMGAVTVLTLFTLAVLYVLREVSAVEVGAPTPTIPEIAAPAETPTPTKTPVRPPTATLTPTETPKFTQALVPTPTFVPLEMAEYAVASPPIAAQLIPQAKIERVVYKELASTLNGGTLYKLQVWVRVVNPQENIDVLQVRIVAEDTFRFLPSTAKPKAEVEQVVLQDNQMASMATFFVEAAEPEEVSIEVIKQEGQSGLVQVHARLACESQLGQGVECAMVIQ